ncbi:MAG: hypothetical protein HFI86_06940 [Bacilli bacterium]|nr:hypothetical protein [Bacilli bacterium]
MSDSNYYDPDLEEEKKEKKKKIKVYWGVLGGILLVGGITIAGVVINSNKNDSKEEKDNTKKEQNTDDIHVIGGTEEVTSATVNEDGTITLNSDIEADASIENSYYTTEPSDASETTITNESSVGLENSDINNTSIDTDENNQVNRTVVTAEEVKSVVNNYYTYLNARVEDSANVVDIGSVYSLAFMANCQYISVDECNKLINEGLIPSDLTTTYTECMNNISLIISENCTKVAVADAFGTELDFDKLIDFSDLFIDETDKNVANKAFDEFTKLVQADKSSINSTFENTIKFIDNATKYSFDEIGAEAKHFNHDYPVNFAQTSVGAQYLVKGIVGREFVWYATNKSIITENESEDLYQLINTVDSPISYLQDKYNGICFDNETVKTYVK